MILVCLGLWAFEQKNTGDYFAQNTDVVQPGPIPPWYFIADLFQ
jgi:hypothetical protein